MLDNWWEEPDDRMNIVEVQNLWDYFDNPAPLAGYWA
jgi:hypothetical protein